jgi:hypothetical protein
MATAIIPLILAFVNPAHAISIKKLAAQLKESGADYTIPETVAADLALPGSIPAKFREVDDTQSRDGLYRVIFLYPADRPEGFIFMTKKVDGYRVEKWYLRTDLNGDPKAGFHESSLIYPDGTSTRNAPSVTKFIGTDRMVTDRLPRELAYWLKGRGRVSKADPYAEPDPFR